MTDQVKGICVVQVDISPEDFIRKNKKLIEMLRALNERAPYEDNKELNEMSTKALLRCGMNTRELSDKVMVSKFYAHGSSIIEKAHRMGYIERKHIKRPTKRRAGNPNLVMNYITWRGKELLDHCNGYVSMLQA
jgi:hypothetical protein